MDDKDERFEYYKENPWEFIRNFVFDIKGPLVSIQGFSELLLKEVVGPVNEKQREFLEIIHRHSQRTGKMANNLRDLSAILYDRNFFPLEKVNLAESIPHIVTKSKEALENKRQEFILQISDSLILIANIYAVEEITFKILDNANKYTDIGGQIILDVETLDNYAKISVSDTGIGITEEDRLNIFKLFFRSPSEQVRSIPGMGTSLFLCKHYIKYFGGQIGFESEPGKGSTFWFTLPIATEEDDPEQQSSHPPD